MAAKRLDLFYNKFREPNPELIKKYEISRSLYSPSWDEKRESEIKQITKEARECSSEIGRIIFLSDIVSNLVY